MSVEQTFLDNGVLGAIILVLAGVIVFLYKQIQTRDKMLSDLQDKLLTRVEEHAKIDTELANKVITTVGTLNELFTSKNRGI